jgi:hypothetical protein
MTSETNRLTRMGAHYAARRSAPTSLEILGVIRQTAGGPLDRSSARSTAATESLAGHEMCRANSATPKVLFAITGVGSGRQGPAATASQDSRRGRTADLPMACGQPFNPGPGARRSSPAPDLLAFRCKLPGGSPSDPENDAAQAPKGRVRSRFYSPSVRGVAALV